MSQSACLNSSFWQTVHPLISLLGGIFVWIGVWDWIVDYAHGDTAGYDWMYMLIGLAFLFLTRTIIPQAGLKPIHYTPTTSTSPPSVFTPVITYLSSQSPPSSPHTSSVPLYLRSLLALLAGITFWLGAYNLFDLHLYEFGSVYRDLIYTAVGLSLMFLTANVASEGTIIADSVDPSLASSSTHQLMKSPTTLVTTTQSFLFYHVKALVGLFGDVIYWVGAYNVADTHLWEASPTRDSLYVVFGFLAFLGISLWTYKERQEAREKRAALRGSGEEDWASLTGNQSGTVGMGDRIAFYLRCVVAMVAGIIVWVGWWNILSTWVVSADEPPTYDNEEGENSEGHRSPFPLTSRFHVMNRGGDGVWGQEAGGHLQSSVHLGWHVMQRSSSTESSFPMWVLYAMYCFTGMVFLVVTNTFTSQAGVIQPLGLIRQQANVGVRPDSGQEAAAQVAAAGRADGEHPQLGVEAVPAFSHAL